MGGSWLDFSGVPFVLALLAQPIAGGWLLERMTRAPDGETRLGRAIGGLALAVAATVGLLVAFDRPGARALMPLAFGAYAVGWIAVAMTVHRPKAARGLAAGFASAAVAAVVSVVMLVLGLNVR